MKFGERVLETTTVTGTGDATLIGAVSDYVAFATAFSVGDRVPYCIEGQTGTEWEIGLGTLTGSSTLERTEVYASSNSNNSVSFSAGTKNAFSTWPAKYATKVPTRGQAIAFQTGCVLQ
jgi:hypothetical protein